MDKGQGVLAVPFVAFLVDGVEKLFLCAKEAVGAARDIHLRDDVVNARRAVQMVEFAAFNKEGARGDERADVPMSSVRQIFGMKLHEQLAGWSISASLKP